MDLIKFTEDPLDWPQVKKTKPESRVKSASINNKVRGGYMDQCEKIFYGKTGREVICSAVFSTQTRQNFCSCWTSNTEDEAGIKSPLTIMIILMKTNNEFMDLY